jgi:gamma-glutamyltranspeptidase
VADGEGRLVAMTFTHGPSWFGSGLLDAASGVLLNTGASIFVRRASDGAVVAQPNLAPSVVRSGDGRYALGSPGGRHIPAIVLQAVIDLVHYGATPERVLGAGRMSASASGAIDAEAELRAAFPDLVRRQIAREEYYGPAGMIAWKDGGARAHCDPRFDGACIHVA